MIEATVFRLLLSAALVMLAHSAPAHASTSNAAAAIESRVTAFAVAFRDADAAVLAGMLAPRYVHTNGGGAPLGREQWLGYVTSRKKELDSGQLRLSRYENQDLQIVLYGKTAVVTGINVSEGSRNGTTFSRRLRFTQVWVEIDGNWHRAAFHDAEASP